MDPGDAATSDDFERLLRALDEADTALRALYRELAEDPDRATEHEPTLRDLHARRIELAQRLGLAVLATRRASARALETVPEPMSAAPSSARAVEGDAVVVEAKEPQPAPEESLPASAPASDAQLAQWKSTVRTTGLGVGLNGVPSEHTAWPLVLHELMSAVGPPRDLKGSVNAIEETDALDDVSSDRQQARWARLPRNAQQLWLSMLVARSRALKEQIPSPALWTRAKEILSRYPPWAKTHSPGHVNGMQVKHGPMDGSWAQDARIYWSALEELLGEELDARSPAPTRKKPRQASSDGVDESEIDPAWRLFPLVRGRKAVIVGGDPREPSRVRIERAFELASLEWPSIDGPRKVDSIVARIAKRTYGLVLVLQPFVAHKESEPIIEAAKAADVPWALVEGYGTSAVKLGLERFLGGPRSEVSAGHADREARG